nr:MAG TPA: hypothetical protein [Caudoviricetes sp.]
MQGERHARHCIRIERNSFKAGRDPGLFLCHKNMINNKGELGEE